MAWWWAWAALLLTACQPGAVVSPSSPPASVPEPLVPPARFAAVEPLVRVRVVSGATSVKIDSPTGWVALRPAENTLAPAGTSADEPGGWDRARSYPTPLLVTGQAGAWMLGTSDGTWSRWSVPVLEVRALHAQAPGFVMVQGTAYPNVVRVQAGADKTARWDVINLVPLETYLPGVLEKELFAKWSGETYRAQAIAARTYALAQLAAHAARPFDMENDEASQAYVGQATRPAALAAVRDTRGAALTWNGKIFPAYFSSCCGGNGQDADIAFPTGSDVPPLQGRAHGAWCQASPNFRWGPITIDRDELARRLAAWGRSHRHPVAALRGIKSIQVTARNAAQRPARFTVTDAGGRRFELGPEDFRFACNTSSSGQPLPPTQALKSSDVEITLQGSRFVFRGRGYGHGVGLCQWGAQGLAQAGYDHVAILMFYYPGARLLKIY